MDFLTNDLRFAIRTLRKQPAFTTTIVGMLALAIGASTAIFSVVESTLLRPLPFRTPTQIVFLGGVAGPQRASRGASFIEIQDWARLNQTFDNIAIYDETSLSLRTQQGADRVEAEMVSASYFPMLGATAALGRVFTPDEDRVPDANPVVVISDGMWTSRFVRDPTIVGRAITLNDRPFTVVGVMRPGFKGISFDTDVWFPSMMARANGGPRDLADRASRFFDGVGRIKDGISLQTAQADLERVAAQLAKDFPLSNRDRSVQAAPLRDSYLGSTRRLVLAVFAAVGLLLLIACANVVGLQLVRASGRRREFALRIAIGADRGRLVQQLVVEGLVLAIAAAIIGVLVAKWGLQGLVMLTPAGLLPNYASPTINLVAFGFAFVTAVGCGLVFGLIPALRGARVDLTDSLKEGSRGSASGFRRGGRLGSQQLLVVGESALAVVLLVGAGLYIRSLQKQLAVSPGFDSRGVLRTRLAFPEKYTPAARLQLIDQLQERLSALPTVRGVAMGSDMPLGGSSTGAYVLIPGTSQSFRFYRHVVTPAFFSSLGITLIVGRAFSDDDRADTPPVIMINESMARRFWPNESPVGKVLRLGDATGPEATVVGVVADVRYRDLTTPLATTEPDLYFPVTQRPPAQLQIAVRSDRSADAITASVRRELSAIDPAIPLYDVRTFETLLAQQTASGRFASTLLAVFGSAALVLTAIGLYGVLAFLVSLRRRELGIRIALGATSARVLRSVIGEGIQLAVIGVAAGSIAAALLTRWIATQLYGVGEHDPLVFVAVPLVLLTVAALASWVPAHRAARVDPQAALRSE